MPVTPFLITAFTLFFSSLIHAEDAQLEVVYEPVKTSDGLPHIHRLKAEDFLPDMLQFINDSVPFAETVTLRMGADDGPLFDPQTNEIWVPIEFLTEIDERFVDANLATSVKQRDNAVEDVFMHTLLHEVAHAIIAQFNIPSLGKEEDAADNLATVLLLEYVEDGDLIALNAADMFALEDQDTDTLEDADFWGEHSLDIQRYYSTICYVYGARPDDNEELVESGELSADKADQCIDEYAQISEDWLFVLAELPQR